MSKRHLYEVDFMRALIILGVVCVHTISFFNTLNSPLSGVNLSFDTLLISLHFTRESFMFITGLVLFITYYHKPIQPIAFWKKRFKLIAIPYMAWTLLYILFSGTYQSNFHWTWSNLVHTYVQSLMFGNQFFLYYLVITMQLYILFPLMVWALRKCARWHSAIFIASFILEIGLMALNQFMLQNMSLTGLPTWLTLLIQYRDRFVLTYQFWFIAGAIVAIHYEPIMAFMKRHTKTLFISLGILILLLWMHMFFDRLGIHESEGMAVLVLQPIMIPYSLLVTLALWRGGLGWAEQRLKPRWHTFSSFIHIAASASFGVFLIHPLMMHYMALFIYAIHPQAALRVLLVPFAITFVYGSAIVIAHFIGKVPLLGYIVGQKANLPTLRKTEVA